jgi:small subunit ribosomal protein S1
MPQLGKHSLRFMTEQETHNLEESASADLSFGEILQEFEQGLQAEDDSPEQVKGTVVSISDDVVVLDIGRKTEGILPIEAVQDASGALQVAAGDTLAVSVTGRGPDGYYTLSRIHVETPKDWSGLEKALAEKTVIAGTVLEAVKGGFRVDVGVPAFLPASRSGVREEAEMAALVGQEIQCRITKVDPDREDVVVDRRAVLEELEAQRREQLFQSLAENSVIRGTVRKLTDFGAFIDLGGVDGLLHVSDMSWGRNVKPGEVVEEGQPIEVKILKVTPETRRISLGLKQLQPDPWSLAEEKYRQGERVQGRVTRLADFGAFVELEPGIEGLIHLSEMSWSKRVRKPSDVLKPGETVDVMVLGANAAERRIGLGLKQVLGDPWEEAARKYGPGSIIEGPVTNLTNFGAFVQLAEGVEGMIHVADITSEKRIKHPNEVLKTGQQVKALVLDFDPDKRRIRLGLKQLEPTTTDQYIAEHQPGEPVSGRVLRVGKDRLEVEVAEGVTATCKLPEAPAAESSSATPSADLSTLTAQLAAKWKQGSTSAGGAGASGYQRGQVLSFRIARLSADEKQIELELAG